MKILRRYKNKALIIQYVKKCDQQRIFVHNPRGSTEQHRRKYNRCMLWLQYKAFDQDFTVSKLEGLWWYDDQKYAGEVRKTVRIRTFFVQVRTVSFIQNQHNHLIINNLKIWYSD